MKVSIIIPVYKDIIALELILEALKEQTYRDFEAIVAEDDNSINIKKFIHSYESKYNIKHFQQEDKGNRKPRAINNAINMSEGEYIIFIDGDTIPYSTFIEYHVLLSAPNIGLCGRRVNLGDKVSFDLRKKHINIKDIEKNFLLKYLYLNSDNIRHYEQGISFKPLGFLYKFISENNKNLNIVASNFSCFKQALIKVNGIDESLPFAPSRDDFDLQWRLEYIGLEMKSCKYCANLFHLNHSRNDRQKEDEENRKLISLKKSRNEYISQQGITQIKFEKTNL